jgi:hypothetical protein
MRFSTIQQPAVKAATKGGTKSGAKAHRLELLHNLEHKTKLRNDELIGKSIHQYATGFASNNIDAYLPDSTDSAAEHNAKVLEQYHFDLQLIWEQHQHSICTPSSEL